MTRRGDDAPVADAVHSVALPGKCQGPPGRTPILPENLLLFIVSVEEAALLLFMSKRQVRTLCGIGELDAKQLGREWAVSLPSVLELADARSAVRARRLSRFAPRR